jgi:phospholipid/cholesterol/gamma-HCH transport system substrate-binding protein
MTSTQPKWSNLKVGIVVLIGLAIFVFIISIVGTEQNIFASTYSLQLFMPNIHGLVNGAMVTLGGLKVGYVTDLQFTRRDSVNGIDVTMKVLTKYRSSITSSTVAQIKTIGLLGDKYVDLSIGSPMETPLAENSLIPLRPTFDIEEVGPELRNSLTDLTDFLKSARRITARIDRGEGSVGKLIHEPTVANEMEHFVRSLNSVVSAIEQKRGAFGKLIYDEPLARNINDVSTNLKDVTDQIRQGRGTVGKLVMDDRLYANLVSFTSRADSILTRASNDSSNVSKIISDPAFYTQLLGLMRDFNDLLVDLKEHPERYVHVSVF